MVLPENINEIENTKKILVVEDDEVSRFLISNLLTRKHYGMVRATNVEDAKMGIKRDLLRLEWMIIFQNPLILMSYMK